MEGGSRGGGLARFRSAPATWLDALLEEDLTRDDALKVGPSSGLTQLLTAGTSSGLARSSSTSASYSPADPGLYSSGGFHRQNSSPADFLTDEYLSNSNYAANYDFLPTGTGSHQMETTASGKRIRDTDADLPSSHSHLKGEPTTLLDLDMDKLLEDSVPCRLRAKRGCATHPRSIAERVRRTRISDRIRKLQDLVPNMDKQTNTADMLEEAVEYVKRLQQQIEELTEIQKNCTCMAKE